VREHAYAAAARVRMLPGPHCAARLCVVKGRGRRPGRGCCVSGSGKNNVPLNLGENKKNVLPEAKHSVDKVVSLTPDRRMTP